MANFNRIAAENSEFPIVCETCLGDNPYVRMLRGREMMKCKVCSRPFTFYRWKPGRNSRYKQTEICASCSKDKNVCQTCLFDLKYGLPVQVRDTLEKESELPGEAGRRAGERLLKIARTAPYYHRNQARICRYFGEGKCTRGAECPFRHEKGETGPDPDIRDRFFGVNDPLAGKLLQKAKEDAVEKKEPMKKAEPIEGTGGLPPEIGTPGNPLPRRIL